MNLNKEDYYKIELDNLLSTNNLSCIYLLYQPIIGYQACAVYTTIAQEARHLKSEVKHDRLLSILGMDLYTFEKSRQLCEEMNLIITYYNPDNKTYIYHVNSPLTTEEFFAHDIFSRELTNKIGVSNFEQTLVKLKKNYFEKANYSNISKEYHTDIFNTWDNSKEEEFNLLQQRSNAIEKINKPAFDFDEFYAHASTNFFPTECRTRDNLEKIADIATLFGINACDMAKLVISSVNISTNSLNLDTLKYKASKIKPKQTNHDNPYHDSPIQFLQKLQGFERVNPSDLNLIKNLMDAYKLNTVVINVLIEYSFNKNNGSLSSAYVEKIASNWAYEGIDTFEKAKEKVTFTKRKYKNGKNKTKLPAYKNGSEVEYDKDAILKRIQASKNY